MTYGSSIFTSWFQLICGSQRSQLEFVLWWCAQHPTHGTAAIEPTSDQLVCKSLMGTVAEGVVWHTGKVLA